MNQRPTRAIKEMRPNERGDERPMIHLGESSSFNLPWSFLDKYPDKDFHYVPYQCSGVELRNEYSNAIDREFEPVLLSTYPELKRRTIRTPFKADEDDDLHKVKGQVLMVRSKEHKLKEERMYDEARSRENYIRSTRSSDPYGLQINEQSEWVVEK